MAWFIASHFLFGVPNEIRTRVIAVKGRCPRPLDEGDRSIQGPQTRAFEAVCGGGKRDRTADLLHAMQALSQLSYTPKTYVLLLSKRCSVSEAQY